MFKKKKDITPQPKKIEMMLDHDGDNWVLSGHALKISAAELEDIDRKLEKALQPELSNEGSLTVFMTTNNEMIPEWIRPYMNHYFNRQLELPLRY